MLTFDEYLFLHEIHPVPDHGQEELVVEAHVVTLQQGRQDLLVQLSLPVRHYQKFDFFINLFCYAEIFNFSKKNG